MSDDMDLEDIPRNTNRSLSKFSLSSSNPNALSESTDGTRPLGKRTLLLVSFSHRRGPLRAPLAPTPGLLFDLRSLHPIKGAGKDLRAAFMNDEQAREKVKGIVGAVKIVMQQGSEEEEPGKPEEIEEDAAIEEGENEEDEDEDESNEDEPEPATRIVVGVCCDLGRHRSVACVEELARVAWPDGWYVEVVHRDLSRVRSEREKERETRKRGERRRSEAGVSGWDD